ncbi:leucyl/phenylalanyl-tRNA--protein transferase [Luteimonas sp. SDU82]|uniref:leucyl/phenylalanyl-tRNA--protein transferase n=1 Tax=Luteimonas sp. SDU82 TaxID=3422592 RepID=UPI003EBC1387
MNLPLPRLSDDPAAPFPDPARALRQPDGLLAYGGDLSPQRLLNAYRRGVFPWFSEGQPILWWSPDPRMVFRSDGVRLSSRFRRGLRRSTWVARADTAFARVIHCCASSPRPGQSGTWITAEMQSAYLHLHRLGHAHSVEVFADADEDAPLLGGIYGIAVGRMFYGESMFSAASGGSTAALAALAHWLHGRGCPLIDAQVENPHLLFLGAAHMPRERFLQAIAPLVEAPVAPGSWTADFGTVPLHSRGR